MKALELPTIDADVAADAGLHPDIHIPYFICVRCGWDIDDTPEAIENHYQFHRLMDQAPKSIPHFNESGNRQRWADEDGDRQQEIVTWGTSR